MFCDPLNLQIMFQSKPPHDNSAPRIPAAQSSLGLMWMDAQEGESRRMAALCQAVAFILSPVSGFDVVADRRGPFFFATGLEIK